MKDKLNIVWVDLELTGLDITKDVIIEMACIVTDKDLNIIEIGPDIVIHQSKEVMEIMDEWNTKHHRESGLTKQVLQSNISTAECEDIMLEFIKKYTKKGYSCLAGSSVHWDRKYLEKHMPKFVAHLHYRIIDVTSVKELVKRWHPSFEYTGKKCSHRALDDIKESIEELKYYQKTFFRKANVQP